MPTSCEASTYVKMKVLKNLSLALSISGFVISSIARVFAIQTNLEIVPVSDVVWEALNPARGDQSPKAGTLWGDLRGTDATGFLAKFVDGFSSPPHIHNVTYRAVVISGEIHNDDPLAEKMWMKAGSFWTQPKGEAHITAARGKSTIALVEIDEGPYLVKQAQEAFDSEERPVNIDTSNIVWVAPTYLDRNEEGPMVSYLWGDPYGEEPSGSFVKLPENFLGYIHSVGSVFRVVIIRGSPKYLGDETVAIPPGSYFSSSGDIMHKIRSAPDRETVMYIRSNESYRIIPSSTD